MGINVTLIKSFKKNILLYSYCAYYQFFLTYIYVLLYVLYRLGIFSAITFIQTRSSTDFDKLY